MSYFNIFSDRITYPQLSLQGKPFRPDVLYPEYPFDPSTIGAQPNEVYRAVRELLMLSEFDSENFGTTNWNPLKEVISPGMRVLVKPNLVMHFNRSGMGEECLYTHPSLISAVIDYVWIALRGKGVIVLADSPVQSCNFEKLSKDSGLSDLIVFYKQNKVNIIFKDLRGLTLSPTLMRDKQSINNDSQGKIIDLGLQSAFSPLPSEDIQKLRITCYDPSELKKHHSELKHEYLVSEELLNADVVINLPKGKTHRKAGVTGALKNMVGVNVRKEFLPHHLQGASQEGGDEYLHSSKFKALASSLADKKNSLIEKDASLSYKSYKIASLAADWLSRKFAEDAYSEGSWYGNDTIWRMVLDLNKIVLFADKNGQFKKDPQRKMLTVSDMIVIGEGEGPLLPRPKSFGLIALSDSSVVHDVALARLMGSDIKIFPTIFHARADNTEYKLPDQEGVLCKSNTPYFDKVPVEQLNEELRFYANPPAGWKDHFIRNNFSK